MTEITQSTQQRQERNRQRRTRAASSPARLSPACWWPTPSPSKWMARALDGTRCSSSGCGAASNTRRSTSKLTTALARLAPPSVATSILESPPPAFETLRHDARSSLLQPSANQLGRLNLADTPRIKAPNFSDNRDRLCQHPSCYLFHTAIDQSSAKIAQ